jgi:hypothetical protein
LFKHAKNTESVNLVYNLVTPKYGFTNYGNNVKVLVDASIPSHISTLKEMFDDQVNYVQQLEYIKKNKIPNMGDLMNVILIYFGTHVKEILNFQKRGAYQ